MGEVFENENGVRRWLKRAAAAPGRGPGAGGRAGPGAGPGAGPVWVEPGPGATVGAPDALLAARGRVIPLELKLIRPAPGGGPGFTAQIRRSQLKTWGIFAAGGVGVILVGGVAGTACVRMCHTPEILAGRFPNWALARNINDIIDFYIAHESKDQQP